MNMNTPIALVADLPCGRCNWDYSFREPLKPGDKLVFCDMAHYTMVKNNTFNGVNLLL